MSFTDVLYSLLMSRDHFKNLDIQIFKDKLRNKLFDSDINTTDPCELSSHYFFSCTHVFDQLAPLTSKGFIMREDTKWLTADLRKTKFECRWLEKKLRQSRLQIDHDIYKVSRQRFPRDIIATTVSQVNNNLVKARDDHCKSMWNFLASLTGKGGASQNVQMMMTKESAETFNEFFLNKVDTIIRDIEDKCLRSPKLVQKVVCLF
jgi:hypothetical protein